MFDSPFAYCPVTKAYVLLDQTRRECAREHGCHGRKCPMQRFFVKYCPVRDVHVALDQSQRQCAREHACTGLHCPLERFFRRGELEKAPWWTAPPMHRPAPLSLR